MIAAMCIIYAAMNMTTVLRLKLKIRRFRHAP
jgi:hypothetical protein